MRFLIRAVLALALAIAAFYFIVGPQVLWNAVGPADQGPVDLATFERPQSRNTALVCPPEFCAAEADLPSPVFSCTPDELFARVREVMEERGAEEVAADEAERTARYVDRTPIMRFPDTVSVRVIPEGDAAQVAMYSRSLVGRSDLGTNLDRLNEVLLDLQLCPGR